MVTIDSFTGVKSLNTISVICKTFAVDLTHWPCLLMLSVMVRIENQQHAFNVHIIISRSCTIWMSPCHTYSQNTWALDSSILHVYSVHFVTNHALTFVHLFIFLIFMSLLGCSLPMNAYCIQGECILHPSEKIATMSKLNLQLWCIFMII